MNNMDENTLNQSDNKGGGMAEKPKKSFSPNNNPFRQLYVGESVGPEDFVRLFSPILVKYSLALFQSGNLVIKGFTGAGKSMLLNLLEPTIRIAYNRLNVPFPIPQEFSKFIGAGINLQTSGVGRFGNRPIDMDYATAPFYFGDYLNFYVVADILLNLQDILKCSEVSSQIGIQATQEQLDKFAVELSKDDCWFGGISEVTNFQSLCKALQQRIVIYKTYLNFNLDEIPAKVKSTKTIIGEPISITANLLKKVRIVNNDVQFFIKIDQFEELAWLGAKNGLGSKYQEMIHTLLGSRNSSVSYRIGTRRFAWLEEKTMFGTTAPLEKKRNYLEFHLDNEMRRKENSRSWIFPDLAEDIFRRRLFCNGFQIPTNTKSLLKRVLGPNTNPKDAAAGYFPNQNRKRAVEVEEWWPKKWKDFLFQLAENDPLSARFGEAWARQKGKEVVMNNIPDSPPYPWDKIYWKKERVEQALMQLASRSNQQLNWCGRDDVLALSGGNILTYLSIFQHIWDVWLRDSRHLERKSNKVPVFDGIVQSVGIIEASTDWYHELAIDERGGKNRKKLISHLGVQFFKTLIEDKPMSNPGHNGFSIDLEQIENNPKLASFLRECVDYGDLYDGPHTSKLKDKRKRWKYYLNPVLSPYFKIPYSHTKEPIYVTITRLVEWFEEANVFLGSNSVRPDNQIKRRRSRNTDQDNSNLLFNF
ncbi:hypothetical protein MuYL_0614 [Mucilaginibacter xinganensis]|uniref:Uncharacterized protein n=2 Tax=Mucilaginibacter xinganensis TaxID=1234841 RepID=A0A223NRQ1_9SPHI|nr:hypothetical protein MuYL_0614 [Mucilaginibacter xinganensis]